MMKLENQSHNEFLYQVSQKIDYPWIDITTPNSILPYLRSVLFSFTFTDLVTRPGLAVYPSVFPTLTFILQKIFYFYDFQ